MSRDVEFGVVFDCDGVLVNTEELGWQVWRSLAGDYGIELTLEDLRAITGCTDEESVSYFRKWLDERALLELGTRFAGAFGAARREELCSYPDAEETLRELRARGIPVVVASNSTTGDVEAALGRTGLAMGWSTRSSGRIRWRLLSRLRTCTSGQRRGWAVTWLWRSRTRRRGSLRRERPGCRCWLSTGGVRSGVAQSRRRWSLRGQLLAVGSAGWRSDQTGTSSKDTAKGTPAISPTRWQLPRRNESGSKSGSPRLSM